MQDTRRKQYNRRLRSLKADREPMVPHWRDLSSYLSTRTSRFLVADRQSAGYIRNSKIMDGTGTLALRTLSSGMMSGITSPARPWFLMRTGDPDLDNLSAVKDWLEQVRRRMMEVFLKSNLYSVLPGVYSDLGLYGTSAFAVLEDEEDTIRCVPFPIGSYYLGSSHRGKVNTCYREYQMTVSQLVDKFGIGKVSAAVKSAYQSQNYDQWHDVVHCVEPNLRYDDGKLGGENKRWRSLYYEAAGTDDTMLEESGFDEFPIMAPRWQTIGEDTYGISPGMDALGDVKMLQLEQKRKLQALDKKVTPPMTGPMSLKNKRSSLLSGDTTYVDVQAGGQKFEAAYQVTLNLTELFQDIQETQGRINRYFFADLFMMIANDSRSNTTATEISARLEEKLLALGPVYLKLNDELLDPLIDRTFAIMARTGQLPPAPAELQNVTLSVEYVSVMAQTMKAIGVAGIERVLTFAGSMSEAFPAILDKIDPDVAIEEYADMVGVPPKIIVEQKAVNATRAARAAQAAQDRQVAMANSMADTGQMMANSPMGENNALSQLAARMQPAGAV